MSYKIEFSNGLFGDIDASPKRGVMPIVKLLPDFGGQEVTVAMVQSLPVATTSFVRQVSTREKREGIQVKTRRKSLIVVTVVVALALTAVLVTASFAVAPPVWAKADKTEFWGHIEFKAFGDLSGFEESERGGMVIGRGLVLVYDDYMSDGRISGVETVVVNYNFHIVEPPVDTTGQMWGTSQVVNDGGSWDVVWSGVRDEQGWAYIRCVAHGRGGYEGLKARFTGVRENSNPLGDINYSGYILEPGAQ